ncbi:TraB/GumN family protein [Noviherbaspirillum agri]
MVASLFIPAVHAEDNAAHAASAPSRGTLYRIRHHGSASYLFGTIHVGKPAYFPLEGEVAQALSQASKLVLEIDVRNDAPFQAALTKHGRYANGETVEQHLSPDSLNLLKQALQESGLAYDSMQHMKPWLLANLLMGLDLERNGYRRQYGIEYFLLSVADREAKAVHELESAEYQMALFADMSDAMQEQYLRETLAEIGSGSALRKAQGLINAWAEANGSAMENVLRASLSENTLSSDFTQRVLLDRRNPEMADKIEALLKNGESSFVGVGLLHLLGEKGLPALLQQRGYTVEKVH